MRWNMKTIEKLKQICKVQLEFEQAEGNKKRVDILTTISKILAEENALKRLDAEIVVNILSDLGMEDSEIPEVYAKILQDK